MTMQSRISDFGFRIGFPGRSKFISDSWHANLLLAGVEMIANEFAPTVGDARTARIGINPQSEIRNPQSP